MNASYRYAAFISYANADRTFARRLHRALEAYHIPAAIGPVHLTDDPRSRNRLYPVFRDREELPSGPLGEAIQKALGDSSALIVVCSPNSARSEWVNKEIRYFESLDRGDRIFAIIAAGEPNAAEHGNERSECFPPALRAATRRAVGEAELEVVAGDARRSADGFRNAWLKVVAGIIGVSAGVLRDRDRRRRARQRLGNFGIAAALIAFVLGAAAWFVIENERIQLRDHGKFLLRSGALKAAVPFAVAAMRPPESILPLPDAEADKVLQSTGLALKRLSTFESEGAVSSVRMLPGGRLLVTASSNQRSLWEINTGRKLAAIGTANVFGAGEAATKDGSLIAVDQNDDSVVVWDTSRLMRVFSVSPSVQEMQFSPDGQRLFTRTLEEGGVLWNAASGAKLMQVPELDHITLGDFSPDGTRLVTVSRGTEVGRLRPGELWDASTGRKLAILGPLDGPWHPKFSNDGVWLLVRNEDNSGTLWNARTGVEAGALAPAGMFGDAEFSPTSDRLLIVSADNSTSLWNLAPFEKIADLDVPGAARSYDWSTRATRLVTRSSEGEAALWDGVSGTKLAAFSSDSALSSESFSDDGALLVVIRKGGGGAILDASTGRALVELDQSSNGITYIHANSLIVTRTDSAASLIALDSGRTLAELGVLDNQDGVALVNKGRWLLLHEQNGEFSLRSADNGAFIGIVASAGVARSVAMSADGTRLAIVYTDHQAALFDASPFARELPTGSALREFVCTANADAIGPFRAADRSMSSPFAAALVGKPWNPCAWRGLLSAQGVVQSLRYWAERAGASWDYRCQDCGAAQ